MNKIFKLHQQYNFFTLFHRLMFNRTEFKTSKNISILQSLKDSLFPKKK